MGALRVCIDARLMSGRAGGVEQVIIGLANGLSKLTDGDEEYLFLAYSDSDEWIRPYLSGPCSLLTGPSCGSMSPAKRFAMLFSDRVVRNAGVDVVHFTSQFAFRTKLPNLYHPHDIQHVHMPQFFSRSKRIARELIYRYFCRQASVVPVVSSWMRRELIKYYHLAQDKVCVVPFAPPLAAYPVPQDKDIRETIDKFSLPGSFVFYPAQTWPHKNHLKLIEALAALRDREGLRVPLVSSGRIYEGHFPAIKARIEELGMQDQIRFLGFVSPVEMQCLYKLCRAVVIPTLYEAASFPLWEAFSSGAPAACSNVTSLPEIAKDAAVIFDPNDLDSIWAL